MEKKCKFERRGLCWNDKQPCGIAIACGAKMDAGDNGVVMLASESVSLGEICDCGYSHPSGCGCGDHCCNCGKRIYPLRDEHGRELPPEGTWAKILKKQEEERIESVFAGISDDVYNSEQSIILPRL